MLDTSAAARTRDFFAVYGDNIIPEPNSGCWLWFAGATTAGYGHITIRDRQYYAHRLAFECEYGLGSADGWIVRHSCDVPACVNPAHLLIGTHKDNSDDMYARGRRVTVMGEDHPRAELTEAQVSEIRRLAPTTHVAEITRLLGVSYASCQDVARGVTWKHLPLAESRARWTPPTKWGEKSPRAKLTQDQVDQIRAHLDLGSTGRSLAKKFGVCPATISHIKVGRNWSMS